jgi:hypothetical protein
MPKEALSSESVRAMHRIAPEALSVVNMMEVRSAWRMETAPNLFLDVSEAHRAVDHPPLLRGEALEAFMLDGEHQGSLKRLLHKPEATLHVGEGQDVTHSIVCVRASDYGFCNRL